jgi:hypothetical protein
MGHQRSTQWHLYVAGLAAFGTYFCMYAFRKPFTAATFEDQQLWGMGLKAILLIAQILGYMVSKFIGIKVISEMRSEWRAAVLVGLIALAELALVGFAYAPLPLKAVMLFLNGLPLGMVFGLVLGFLEGRRHTEALSAALCASFIVSSGVVKSVGRWLLDTWQVSEFEMPMLVGLLFFPPLLLSVWWLQATPAPDAADRQQRSERTVMDSHQRRSFLSAYGLGLTLLVLVYTLLTVVRTVRDDFGVEIWRDLGVTQTPEIFAYSETTVALVVTALNGLAILIACNLRALRVTMGLMAGSFLLTGCVAVLQVGGGLSPFAFMVACGVGLYVPYVAFHTTVFERLIAASRRPCNLGFLMYLADAIGYLGYASVILVREKLKTTPDTSLNSAPVLPFFVWSLLVVAVVAVGALALATVYFERRLGNPQEPADADRPTPLVAEVVAAE